MKSVIIVCVIACLAIAASATSVPFKSCGSGAATVTNLDLTPYPVQKGKTLAVNASGTLSETLTSGNYNLVVKYLGIQVLSKTGNLCTLNPNYKCPFRPGPIAIYDSATIPSIAPSGSYSITINATDQNNKLLLCVTVTIQISVSSPGEELTLDEAEEILKEFENKMLFKETAELASNAPVAPVAQEQVVAAAAPAKPVQASP